MIAPLQSSLEYYKNAAEGEAKGKEKEEAAKENEEVKEDGKEINVREQGNTQVKYYPLTLSYSCKQVQHWGEPAVQMENII